MASSTTYNYIFKSDTANAKTGVENLGKSVEGTTTKMDKLGKKLSETGDKVSGLGKKLTVGLTGSIALIGGLALKQAASLETMEVAFTSMTGSAEKASEVVKSLVDFTARTPFQLEGVGKAAKQLLSFGVTTEQLEDRLKFLGDIAAGANVPLSDMAAIFGKSKAKGKAMTEELLQLSDRGIPIIQVLADEMGVAKSEIFDMASQGKISFDILSNAMRTMTEEGGIFEDQMSKQSMTLAGLFSTLKDNVSLALAEIGKDLAETVNLKELIAGLTEKIQAATEWFKNLSPEVKKTIFVVTGLVAAVGPLLITIGAMIKIVGLAVAGIGAIKVALLALMGPVGIVIAAVGLMTVAIKKNWLGLGDFAKKAWGGITKTVAIAQDRMKDFTALSWKDRLKIITIGARGALKVFVAFKKDMLGNVVVLGKSALKLFLLLSKKLANVDWSGIWKSFKETAVSWLKNIGNSIGDFAGQIWDNLKARLTGGEVKPLEFNFPPIVAKGADKIKETFESILGQEELFQHTKQAISEVGAEMDEVLKKGAQKRTMDDFFGAVNKPGANKDILKELRRDAAKTTDRDALASIRQKIADQERIAAEAGMEMQGQSVDSNDKIQQSEEKTQESYETTEKTVDDLAKGHGKGFDTMVKKTNTTVDVMKEKLAQLKSTLGEIRSITAPKEGPDKRTDAQVFAMTGAPDPLSPDPFTDNGDTGTDSSIAMVANPKTMTRDEKRAARHITDDPNTMPINVTFQNNKFSTLDEAKKTAALMEKSLVSVLRDARRKGIA